MTTLARFGAASAAILKKLIGPMVGRDAIADAVGYVTNAGAPTSVTPEFIGQHLLDTTNNAWYKAYGVSSGNWNPAGSVGGGATAAEIDRAADVSSRVVNATSSTLTVTEAAHDKKIIVLDRAAGIAVTLPAASAGLEFEFIVKTTFTGAASIKSVASADIMIGQALLGNDSDNTVVAWQSLAASTNDTIDLFGTANSTGGIAGQRIRILGLATNLWHVDITGDAAGTEATPFANTVA